MESNTVDTPREYTNDLYRVYFEVGEKEGFAAKVITEFMLVRSRGIVGLRFTPASLRPHRYGYELDIPLQLVPEIARELAKYNVAMYQIIRGDKL